MNKCFGLWSKQRWRQHRCTAEALEGGEVRLAVTFRQLSYHPAGLLHMCGFFQRLFSVFLSFSFSFFLSFFFFLQQKRVKANKNTRRTCTFLILFFKHYRHMHRAVQVRRELKWHSFVFSKKKKKKYRTSDWHSKTSRGSRKHIEVVQSFARCAVALSPEGYVYRETPMNNEKFWIELYNNLLFTHVLLNVNSVYLCVCVSATPRQSVLDMRSELCKIF